MARAAGANNARVSEDVLAFCQAFHFKSPKAYKLLRDTVFGVSQRHIRRLEAQDSSECILDETTVYKRVDTWAGVGAMKGTKIVASMCLDATKVAKREEVSSRYKIVVGGKYPTHKEPILDKGTPIDRENLADEVKCFLVTSQDVVQCFSPVTMVAARPQSTNERDDAYNGRVVDAVVRSSHLNLVSVAADGLSAESLFIRDGLVDFMLGNTNYVFMVDPNHVAKAYRSQIVLGSRSLTMGDSVIDPGLLMVAGVNSDLYRVQDFTSDLLVLQLCSGNTLQQLLSIQASEDVSSIVVTGLTLFFLRVFLIAVNSKVDVLDRPYFLWCAFLWLSSVEGLPDATKRNLATSVVASVFLCMQQRVKAPRFCTTEPIEHMFGNVRARHREFTTKELVEHVGRLETTFKNMTKFDIVGSSEHRGYLSGFAGYREHLAEVLRGGADSPAVPPTSFSVDVNYESEASVASQIEQSFVELCNAATRDMGPFLNGMGCADVSPFCRRFGSLKELAQVYFEYMGGSHLQDSRHAAILWSLHPRCAPGQEVTPEENDVEEGDGAAEGADAEEDDILAMVESFARHLDEGTENDDAGESELPPMCSLEEPIVLDVFNCAAFKSLLEVRVDDANASEALVWAEKCLSDFKATQRGQADGVQKFKSLTGRWFAATQARGQEATRGGVPPAARDYLLKRNDILYYDRRYIRVLSVYRKSYNKWRQEASGSADNGTVVHVVEALHAGGLLRENDSMPVRNRTKLMRGDALATALIIVL
eukprot:GHVU01070779.1.p1 GENE.GHVU01070779.1~~GHVU01070779.1.p1  ORF type:complete len:762 (+),score=80.80 GHVU01070779.1:258-2543(+)